MVGQNPDDNIDDSNQNNDNATNVEDGNLKSGGKRLTEKANESPSDKQETAKK